MGAPRRNWFGPVLLSLLVLGGATAVVLIAAWPIRERAGSPATGAFQTLGVPMPRFACDRDDLLGGGYITPLEDVGGASAQEVMMAARQRLVGSGYDQFARLSVLSATAHQLVVGTGTERSVTAAAVVESGPSAMTDQRGDPGEGWSLKAIAFCPR